MSTIAPTAPPAESQGDPWYGLSGEEACRTLDVDPAVGLNPDEVAKRRARYGSNKLAEVAKEPAWKAFVRQYRDLMQLVLVGAALVSIVAIQDVSTGLVVLGITVFNALLGLHQEGKAAESVAALRQMLIISANVRRGGERVRLPAEELVPGDIVGFEAGDKVPADGRLLVAATLGDGVNDAPALTRADIGVAMGITGTEVTKDAAEMILTDDNFATIVTAVQRGRALYDNLMKYVRVQMVFLAGFILTFVGAGIFTIADGQPLLPLQILWINFATDVVLALGLGFDAESPGLMERRPRPTDQPVVPVPLGLRLGFAGLLIAVGTLSVVAWAEDRYGLATATTMGLVTTGLLHIAAAIEWRDPIRSIFNRATIANGRFNLLVLLAFVLTFLATTLGGLQRLLDTVELDGDQWRACLVAVIGYLALAEIGKFIFRHVHKGAVA